MAADGFRRIALSLPEAIEQEHMNHPDFRVRGKVFATLTHPSAEWGMVKLPPAYQQTFVQSDPGACVAVKRAWGRQGCTSVRLKAVKRDMLLRALRLAWMNAAPKELRGSFMMRLDDCRYGYGSRRARSDSAQYK
jgi:hypothetical protein